MDLPNGYPSDDRWSTTMQTATYSADLAAGGSVNLSLISNLTYSEYANNVNTTAGIEKYFDVNLFYGLFGSYSGDPRAVRAFQLEYTFSQGVDSVRLAGFEHPDFALTSYSYNTSTHKLLCRFTAIRDDVLIQQGNSFGLNLNLPLIVSMPQSNTIPIWWDVGCRIASFTTVTYNPPSVRVHDDGTREAIEAQQEQQQQQYDEFTSDGNTSGGSNPAVDSATSVVDKLDKTGLGSQITAIASDVMGVFGAEGVPDATLTLPALRLTVQGVEYEVWPDYTFDFAMLDTWGFSALMSAVRFGTVAAVYLALLKYMVALIDSIIEDRALEMVIAEAD